MALDQRVVGGRLQIGVFIARDQQRGRQQGQRLVFEVGQCIPVGECDPVLHDHRLASFAGGFKRCRVKNPGVRSLSRAKGI